MPVIGDKLYAKGRFRDEWDNGTEITGETKQSWLLGDPRYAQSKVNKKTLSEADGRGRGMGPLQWYTEDGMRAKKLVDAHGHKIAQKLHDVRDPETLKAVAKLIGYTIEEE